VTSRKRRRNALKAVFGEIDVPNLLFPLHHEVAVDASTESEKRKMVKRTRTDKVWSMEKEAVGCRKETKVTYNF
jgi:hypothetical protein